MIAKAMIAKAKADANGTTTALYQRIRGDIEGKIMSGDWPPGHRVPFEHELMESYDCSRMTVNKVLSGLAAAGLRRAAPTGRQFCVAPAGAVGDPANP